MTTRLMSFVLAAMALLATAARGDSGFVFDAPPIDIQFSGPNALFQYAANGGGGIISVLPDSTDVVELRSFTGGQGGRGFATDMGALIFTDTPVSSGVTFKAELVPYTGGPGVTVLEHAGAGSMQFESFTPDRHAFVMGFGEADGDDSVSSVIRGTLDGEPPAVLAQFTEVLPADNIPIVPQVIVAGSDAYYLRGRDLWRVPIDGSAAASKIYTEPNQPVPFPQKVGLSLQRPAGLWLPLHSSPVESGFIDYTRLYRITDGATRLVGGENYIDPAGNRAVARTFEPTTSIPVESSVRVTDLNSGEVHMLVSGPIATLTGIKTVFWDLDLAVVMENHQLVTVPFDGSTSITLTPPGMDIVEPSIGGFESRLYFQTSDRVWRYVDPRGGTLFEVPEPKFVTVAIPTPASPYSTLSLLEFAPGAYWGEELGWIDTPFDGSGTPLQLRAINVGAGRAFFDEVSCCTFVGDAEVNLLDAKTVSTDLIAARAVGPSPFADANDDHVLDCADATAVALKRR